MTQGQRPRGRPGGDHLPRGLLPLTRSPVTLTGIWGAAPLWQEPQQALHLALLSVNLETSGTSPLSPGPPPRGPSVRATAPLVELPGHPDPAPQTLHPGHVTCPQGLSPSSPVLHVASTPRAVESPRHWLPSLLPHTRDMDGASTPRPQPAAYTALPLGWDSSAHFPSPRRP